VLSAESQAKIATTRRYQDVVQQVPGVSGGSNPVMAGGSFRHNRYLVDGLDITDPVSNTFSANFNFDAIAQMDLLLLAVDAQYNSLGGVINLVTKRGSDRFNVDASLFVNHQSLSVGSRAGSQIFEGRLRDQSDPPPPNASYQANLNIGGPIVKQKLWYYLSMQYWYRLSSVVPGPPLNSQHPPLDRHDAEYRPGLDQQHPQPEPSQWQQQLLRARVRVQPAPGRRVRHPELRLVHSRQPDLWRPDGPSAQHHHQRGPEWRSDQRIVFRSRQHHHLERRRCRHLGR
jgi:hypothetical protein